MSSGGDRLCVHLDVGDLVHAVMGKTRKMSGTFAQQVDIVIFHDHEIRIDMIGFLPLGDQLLAQIIMQVGERDGLALLDGRKQRLDVG